MELSLNSCRWGGSRSRWTTVSVDDGLGGRRSRWTTVSVDDGLGGRRSRWTNGNGARVSFAAMDYERTGFSYSGPRDCERRRGRILPGQVLGSRPVFADSIEGCVGE